MTKEERIDAVFEGRLPDRIPISDKLRNNMAIEHYTGTKLTEENKFEVVTEECWAGGSVGDGCAGLYTSLELPARYINGSSSSSRSGGVQSGCGRKRSRS